MRASPTLIAMESPATDLADIDSTLRSLVSQVNALQLKSNPGSSLDLEEVLMDEEIDGTRYLLIRMPQVKSRIRLSPREQEIVRMVAKGHPNKVIADVLNISSWTVCTHLRRIFAKLGVGSRAAMVAQLLEIGALNPDHRLPATR
jgi:DNA-binding CsgD family transcriptional regulator